MGSSAMIQPQVREFAMQTQLVLGKMIQQHIAFAPNMVEALSMLGIMHSIADIADILQITWINWWAIARLT